VLTKQTTLSSDSDLSSGSVNPPFEQPEPGLRLISAVLALIQGSLELAVLIIQRLSTSVCTL